MDSEDRSIDEVRGRIGQPSLGPSLVENSSELERMVNLLALAADVMRTLAGPQDKDRQRAIKNLAASVEDAALRLVDILYPQHDQDADTQAPSKPLRSGP